MTSLRSWTPAQRVLRTLIAVAPVLALVASLPAGAHVSVAFFLLVVGLSIVDAILTESSMGLVAMLLVLFWWGTRVSDPLSPWVLAAAAALLVAHVASVLADYGPPTLQLDRDLLRLWLRRAVLTFLAAPVAWLMARLVDDAPDQPGIWVVGLAAGLVAVVAATVTLRFPEPSE